MARIAGVDIPREKKVPYSLCYIHGIGLTTAQEICKRAKVDQDARVKDLSNGNVLELPTAGIFIAIGHTPNTEVFTGQLKMDDDGYLITKPDSTATDIPGIYAAGDVQDHIFRQAVTAASSGCMAALDAERWLESRAD